MNRVVVVVANTMGPLERDVLPPEAFDGIESEMDCMVRRVSSVLIPRPTRTMISENCTEEQKECEHNQVGEEKEFRGYVRRCPVSSGSVKDGVRECARKQKKSMRHGTNDHLR